jgi:archaellum biogenesis ATPase FlaH
MQDSYARFEQANVYANFNLDKSLSYFKLKKIMDQLGKAGFVWGQLTLQDGKVFKKEISLQNNLANSKDIISEINDYFSSEKFLYCEVSNNSMDFSDSSGTKLNNVKDYLVSPKNDFLIIYKFHPNSTYQDYINFFSLIFKSMDEKRNVFVSKGHTKAEAIKRYPLAMIELENLIYSIPKLLMGSDSIPR